MVICNRGVVSRFPGYILTETTKTPTVVKILYNINSPSSICGIHNLVLNKVWTIFVDTF